MNKQTISTRDRMGNPTGSRIISTGVVRVFLFAAMLLASVYGAASAHPVLISSGQGEPLCEILAFCGYPSSQSATTPVFQSGGQTAALLAEMGVSGSQAARADNQPGLTNGSQAEPLLMVMGASGYPNGQSLSQNSASYSTYARAFCQEVGICSTLTRESAASITTNPSIRTVQQAEGMCVASTNC